MDGKMNLAEKPASAKIFDCTNCGAPITVRAMGQSQVCACVACGSVLDANSEAHEVLVTSDQKKWKSQAIPLGTRGKIHGSLWEVIGYMERWDGGSYHWAEYLLFNPMKGFRWLAENNGHWSYVLMTKERPKQVFEKALYGGHYYDLFHKGHAEISYIIGEFYWQARVGEKVRVHDYIRHNEVLSCEDSGSEIIWSVSEYIEADTVKNAFKVKTMPVQFGVAPNQPCPISPTLKEINKFWAFFLIALVLIQFSTMVTSQSKEVHSEDFSVITGGPVNPFKSTRPFEINDDKVSNVQVKLKSPLNNSWIYLQGELVNLESGEQFEFDQGVEYYSGYDGEYWSEGDQTSFKNIPKIPPGKYQINFEASSDATNSFQLTVIRDVPLWKGFFWSLALVSIWPLFLFWRRRSFNMRKWADSDYNPYAQYSEYDE